jgi:hypothetical protein
MGVINIWGVATSQSGGTATYVLGFTFQKLFSVTCFAFDVSSRHNSPRNEQSLWMSSSEEDSDASAREMQPASNFSQSTISTLKCSPLAPCHLPRRLIPPQ